ncbi:UNVERIFIED_CONTAM: RGG repeats nuclear RNA binding protein A [Sesamum angustifolium]|uniref:RGG repeats nuclear RNA binding protein A n=1 Tax=Sesamum angustifolium TaxID=2727405 RepID=A0AAW2MJ19_9LAMI
MATLNPFGLLGDDDAEDPTLLVAAQQKAAGPVKATVQEKKSPSQAQPAAKLPSKPLPPAQAVKESRNEGQRGGHGGGRGTGCGHGGHEFSGDLVDNENEFRNSNGSGVYKPSEKGDDGRPPFERRPYGVPQGSGGPRGGRRGDFSNGEAAEGDHPRRVFDRRSGTGRGTEYKREGAGRGNWGRQTDEIVQETEESDSEGVKNVDWTKRSGRDDVGDANKDTSAKEQEEKEPEEKEITLEEYEKVLEEKRKALLALKSQERKVDLDKELESMQLLSNKKNDDDVFIKLI